MNFIEYEMQKVKKLSAEQCCWKLFSLTGQVNYYLLYSAISDVEKEHTWTNLESPEL